MRIAPAVLALLSILPLAAQAELRIAAGITPTQNVFQRIQGPFERATGLKLVIVDARSPSAWDLLDKGQVEAASAGLTWEDWLKSIQDKALRVPAPNEVRTYRIGTDRIQVLTHLDTVVLDLDKAQVLGIFTGALKDWKALGLEPAPITVVIDPNQIATNDVFRARMLDGAPFREDALKVPKGQTILQVIESTPGAVGFAPKASLQSPKANSPVTPEVSRPVLLLIKGQKPSPSVQKLLDYLDTPEAKKLVAP